MIVVTGSLAFDHIMNFPGKFSEHILPEKLHVLSLSFLVDKLKKEKGGTAGNIAYNLALLGTVPKVAGCVGTDFLQYRKHLETIGVDVSGIKVVDNEFTSSAFIMTDQVDNQISGFYPGAMNKNHELRITDLELKRDKIVMVVISPNDPVAMNNFVEECIENKIPYMYDPGMQLPRLTDKELIRGVTNAEIVIGNDYEIGMMEKRIGLSKVILTVDDRQEIVSKKSKLIITTLGENGCQIKMWNEGISRTKAQLGLIGQSGTKAQLINKEQPRNKEQLRLKGQFGTKVFNIPPAKPINVSDPTGAGDAFRGGFLAGYLRGFPLEVCGKMGNLAAVYTVEKYGTQTHKYTLQEFCNRYEKNFREKLILV